VLAAVAGLDDVGRARIQKVFFGGEHLQEDERAWLRDRLPNLSILASAGYGAVDTGIMAFQCPHSEGSDHHVHADHVWMEIVDPVTAVPVSAGEEGTVLVTMLDRTLLPLIRYDLGDRARWIEGACACGRNSPRFRLLGRQDDLRIGIATVGHDEMVLAASLVPGLTSRIQIIKERADRRDRLSVRVEALDEVSDADRGLLAEQFLAAIRQTKPDIGTLIDSGHIHPLTIRILDPGQIPRSPVTGKVIRTRDCSLEA
jgi:phenylacetate-coenzyme A ligase PaaK-like adenylate-forming protein